MSSVSVVGLGVVGGAFYKCLKHKGVNVVGYDKFKDSDPFEDVLRTEIAFLSLPTPYDDDLGEYNKSAIHDVCRLLDKAEYTGTVVLQSTVEPETTDHLDDMYKSLHFVHSPEFISAKTAFEDMMNQNHVVLGRSRICSDECFDCVYNFYQTHFPNATISVCKTIESETMKIGINSFYAVKIQFLNELYLVCQQNGGDYDRVIHMMLKNGWINAMHTSVPGTDGKLSYGGMCFPKDTNALLQYMSRLQSP
ncbi:unnamed protein product, partial [marine sediment metagenome]